MQGMEYLTGTSQTAIFPPVDLGTPCTPVATTRGLKGLLLIWQNLHFHFVHFSHIQ